VGSVGFAFRAWVRQRWRAARARLAGSVTRAGCQPGICLLVSGQWPADIRDYTTVRDTPLVLGIMLALLAVGTLAHVLVTSVRRRRELAILKVLGLVRRQLLLVVCWEAIALAALIAAWPGRAAARVRVAVVLRAE
jgi:predicted lysophospholipase L1 biosynthesis ABC-type transport system permease subunit